VLVEAAYQLGDSVRARAAANTARLLYEQALVRSPNEAELHAGLGLVLAYQGVGDQAVREGTRAKTLVPVATDAVAGPIYQAALVRIHLLLGEPQEALHELLLLLRIPGPLSPARLSVDPTFDPVRGLPGFQELLAAPNTRRP
jgi:hypothetical protein